MKTKQEVIQQHYIDLLNADKFFKLKPHIDENGWCTMFGQSGEKISPVFIELGFTTDPSGLTVDAGNKEGCMVWRPKSLAGIDGNNGWTLISSEGGYNLPKDEGYKYRVGKFLDKDYFYISGDFLDKDEVFEYCKELGHTHWQPVEEILPPIY